MKDQSDSVAADEGTRAAQDFVTAFQEAWRSSDVDRFLEAFKPLMHAEIRLIQPMVANTSGFEAFCDEFRRVFYLIPDLTATVERWASQGNLVFIELTLHGTLEGIPIALRACDRILLDGDICIERESYFDPSSLILCVARTPKTWLRWWRSGVGPPRRTFRG